MAARPKVGGFPYLAKLRQAGVTRNSWFLPSCQSLDRLRLGPVVIQGTPLISGMQDVPPFDRDALITALRIDQAGKEHVPSVPAATPAGLELFDMKSISEPERSRTTALPMKI